MVQLDTGFTKKAVEWKSVGTTKAAHPKICQETLLLIDVGIKSLLLGSKGTSKAESKTTLDIQKFSGGPGIVAASYVHFCDTELCNNADSTSVLLNNLSLASFSKKKKSSECPVCLKFQGSCSQEGKFMLCPMATHCYYSDITVEGGGLNIIFSIDGCLTNSAKDLLNNQTSVGIFSIIEASDQNITTSFSHVLVPSTLPVWMLGLRAFLSPLFTKICSLC
nr:CD177 antigen-like isoform X2 [Arvicanthis niloticus]